MKITKRRQQRNEWITLGLAITLIGIGAVLAVPGDTHHHLHEPWFAASLVTFFSGMAIFLVLIFRK